MPEPTTSVGALKLVEALVTFGIAPLLRPWQMRREGAAQAHNKLRMMLAEAQGNLLAQQIEDGGKQYDPISGEVYDVLSPTRLGMKSYSELEAHKEYAVGIAKAALSDGFRKAENLGNAIEYAREGLNEASDETISSDPVEEDWFHRWRAGAENVSSDELQKLWGKILANEVGRPGSSSLNTLDVMRRLSAGDARFVERILSYSFGPQVIFGTKDPRASRELSPDDLLLAQELGIVASTSLIGAHTLKWIGMPGERKIAVKLPSGQGLIFEKDAPPISLELPVIPLTRVGREFLKIGSFSEAPIEYLQAIADVAKSKGLSVKLARNETRDGVEYPVPIRSL